MKSLSLNQQTKKKVFKATTYKKEPESVKKAKNTTTDSSPKMQDETCEVKQATQYSLTDKIKYNHERKHIDNYNTGLPQTTSEATLPSPNEAASTQPTILQSKKNS